MITPIGEDEEAPPRVNVRVLSLSHIQLNRGENDEPTSENVGANQRQSDSDLEEYRPPQCQKLHIRCPISRLSMVDPVVCPHDGLSYERKAIVTRARRGNYYSNRALLEYTKPE
jgi:hypothetical protein